MFKTSIQRLFVYFFLVSVEVYCENSKHAQKISKTYPESAFQHQKIGNQKIENKQKLSERSKFTICHRTLDVLIQNICLRVGHRQLYQANRRSKSNNPAQYKSRDRYKVR